MSIVSIEILNYFYGKKQIVKEVKLGIGEKKLTSCGIGLQRVRAGYPFDRCAQGVARGGVGKLARSGTDLPRLRREEARLSPTTRPR